MSELTPYSKIISSFTQAPESNVVVGWKMDLEHIYFHFVSAKMTDDPTIYVLHRRGFNPDSVRKAIRKHHSTSIGSFLSDLIPDGEVGVRPMSASDFIKQNPMHFRDFPVTLIETSIPPSSDHQGILLWL